MKNLLLSLFLFFISTISVAQTGQLSGVIRDAASGEPLIGANIAIEETSTGLATNRFGQFAIPAIEAGTYHISVSYIGFEKLKQEVQIQDGEETRLELSMNLAKVLLEDVEITESLQQNTALISALDIRLRPITNSQDILKIVPGLFIAQHAGGGKAEQIFLRGFDIDHGTDIALSVDGMPVNMVSHAHGQGYSDLHFVIPETVERVAFDKGPYDARKGNLNTAGFADFHTKKRLPKNQIKLEMGQFGTRRVLGMANLLKASENRNNPSLYLATAYTLTDGYFESPQHFNRFNGLIKYYDQSKAGHTFELSVSAFRSRWSASGQIPLRAVNNGSISRFGAIDDTEGGKTSRYNFNALFNLDLNNGSFIENQFYVSRYNFDLISNFTFFLNDPENGDQIRQSEGRTLWGSKHTYWSDWSLLGLEAYSEFGIGFRQDLIKDIRLSQTLAKNTIVADLARGDITESNIYLYAEEEVNLNDRLHLTAGLRYDLFRFKYEDALLSSVNRTMQTIFSPKAKLSYQAADNLNLYVKSGIGFHSNDTRVVIARSAQQTLPKAYGLDIGTLWKPMDNLLVNLAFWRLDLDQEFVYVGDAGIVEAGGRTKRQGIELGTRYQFSPYLYANVDLNVTDPRSVDNPESQSFIPLAPTFTSLGSLNFESRKGISGHVGYRFLDDRPANEDNSLTAEGYFLLDVALRYKVGAFDLGLTIENLLNREWREAQFETESRLAGEAMPVSEIHFTPGTPFQARISASIEF